MMTSKQEIRAKIRALKRDMTEQEIAEKSEMIAKKLFRSDIYRKANAIYGYMSINQEVRMRPILERALSDGKRVAIPKIMDQTMRFILIENLSDVKPGFSKIPEPIADGPIAEIQDALVIMPGLAFDMAGHRIGYGGGYYDRFLAKEPDHPTIALCYHFQIFDKLCVEEFDIPVDEVISN